MKEKDWTDELRDRLDDYEAVVPEGLWADIEQALPTRQRAVRMPLWRRWAGVAAMAALLAGTGWWMWPEKPIAPQQQEAEAGKPHQQQSSAEPQPLVAQAVARPRSNRVQAAITAPASEVTPSDTATAPVREVPPRDTATATARQPVLPQPATKTLQEHPQTADTREALRSRPSASVGLYADNGLLAYSHANGVRMSPELSQRYDYSPYMPQRAPAADETIWLTDYEEQQHHDRPVALGLTVNYPLNGRWSLQAGLVYTRLDAEFVTVMRQTHLSRKQSLHYVGIPLSVQYQVLGGRHWRLYASMGVQADWNVRARSETEGVTHTMPRDRLQWSLRGAVGAEYNVVARLGIFAEPALHGYFDNGSAVQNFFKDQPVSWNILLGMRWSLASPK